MCIKIIVSNDYKKKREKLKINYFIEVNKLRGFFLQETLFRHLSVIQNSFGTTYKKIKPVRPFCTVYLNILCNLLGGKKNAKHT